MINIAGIRPVYEEKKEIRYLYGIQKSFYVDNFENCGIPEVYEKIGYLYGMLAKKSRAPTYTDLFFLL